MSPDPKRVARTFLERLKKAREGEIASNPVIENMEGSPFVSENPEAKEDKDKSPEEHHDEAT